ncbi:MAG: TVP38/TMEM64 family protein [Planctomycetota bacterium]
MQGESRRLVRAVVGVLLLVGVVAVLLTTPDSAIDDLRRAVADAGAWGPLLFIATYVVATVLMAPGTPLTIAAGVMFDIVTGTVLVSIASTLGASLAFLISRYVAHDTVQRIIETRPRVAAVDAAIRRGGWKVLALMRLSPVIPFNLQNYLLGLTSLRVVTFVLTSWATMLPATLLYVYLGHMATQHGEAAHIALIVGLVATVIVVLYTAHLARRELARTMANADHADP